MGIRRNARRSRETKDHAGEQEGRKGKHHARRWTRLEPRIRSIYSSTTVRRPASSSARTTSRPTTTAAGDEPSQSRAVGAAGTVWRASVHGHATAYANANATAPGVWRPSRSSAWACTCPLIAAASTDANGFCWTGGRTDGVPVPCATRPTAAGPSPSSIASGATLLNH